jgi:hypothetical protein
MLNPFTMRPPRQGRTLRWRSLASGEPLHVSTIRETLVCPVCQLSQFEPGNGKCRRCHRSLGLAYIEIFATNPIARPNSQRLSTMRL